MTNTDITEDMKATSKEQRSTRALRRQTAKRPSARKALDYWYETAQAHGYTTYVPEYSAKHFGQMKHWLDAQYMAGKTHAAICNHISLVICSWPMICASIKDDYGKRMCLDRIPTFEQYIRYQRKIDSLLLSAAQTKSNNGNERKRIVFPV